MSDLPGTRVGPVMIYSARQKEVVDFYRALIGLSGESDQIAVWLEGANAQVVVHQPTAPETPP